jgi:hypothetical protein
MVACRKIMKLWGFQDHEECPSCPETKEETLHILECPPPSTMMMTWSKCLTKLQMWMETMNAMPELQDALVTRIPQWKGEMESYST